MLQKIKKYTLVSLAVLALSACGGGGGGSDGNGGLATASSTGDTVSTSQTGVFIDSPVEGLLYETSSFSGETDVDGKFQYVAGETVKFYIGTYYLGEAKGATAVTPYQLYPNDENAALRVARLLQTIDADNDASNGITLVNQEQFSSLDSTVSPSSIYFEHELNNQLGLALTVTKAEAKQHLDKTITDAKIQDTTAPVFTSAKAVSVKENQRTALTLRATDSQSSIRYSLAGTDAFSFNINATTGVVTFKVAPDYETKKSYVITAIATDLANNEVRKNLTIKILDVDEYVPDTTAPTFRSQNVVSVNENQTSALTVKATDSQSSIRYSLSGADAFHFNVNGTTGVVTFKVAPDYETKTTYNFTATATDTAENSVNQNVTVNILDINEVIPDTTAPVFTSATSVHVNENQTDVLTLTATDSQSTISYSILSQIDASSFNVNRTTGVVTFKVAPDYEVKNRYIFKARATDSAGNKSDQQITVVVSDVNENVADTVAPVFTSTNVVSVNENQTSALTLAATDTQSSVLYSLAGADAFHFNVNGTTGVVTFKVAPDYETKTTYNFTATATDTAENSVNQNVTVNILDINEVIPDTTAPVFTSATSVHVNENQTDVLTLTATDSQSTISYSILSQIDASSFNVNRTTGVVTFKVAPDYEVKNRYIFKARATDSAGNKSDQQITVVVSDVNENVADTVAPVFTSTNVVSVNENQTSALTLAATDTQSSVLYSLAGADASSFNVNTTIGVVTFKSAPDYEAKSIYDFTARATDEAGNISTQDIKVTILDVNENASGGSNDNIDRTKIHTVNLLQLAQDSGQTTREYLLDQFKQKELATFVENDKKIFSQYSSSSSSTYATGNWASQFDFSGVAWDNIKAGTLITNQHIVQANHFKKVPGDKVVFHAKDGSKVIRTIIAYKKLEEINPDLWDGVVLKLDEPVPSSIKVYSLFDPDGMGNLSSLNGIQGVSTNQFRQAYIEKIERFMVNDNYMPYNILMLPDSNYPSFMWYKPENGISGNPQFFIVNGELVFSAVTHGMYSNRTIREFSGYKVHNAALQQAIESMKDIH